MPPALLAKVHGASTHFPITLALSSWLLDALAFAFHGRRWVHVVEVAAAWAIGAASVSMLPAIISGVLMTRGVVWGHDLLRLHHLFVWPAFALIVSLTVWRIQVREPQARGTRAVYLLCGFAAAGLISAAGYWGGELLLAG